MVWEVDVKLALLRAAIADQGLAGLRLRGSDWFAWVTAGGSNTVLSTTDTGVAEIFVTEAAAYVLTNVIEAERLKAEVVPSPFVVWSCPWQDPHLRDVFVRDHCDEKSLASDRPQDGERALPGDLLRARRRLLPSEIERYRVLGAEAAVAVTEALSQARPEWTEMDLAACGAAALWRRGIHPAVVLVAGDSRVERFRHPVPTTARLGERAMLNVCGRRHGLFANLTRFVYFRAPTAGEQKLKNDVATVEAAAWLASSPGSGLDAAFERIVEAYRAVGHGGEEMRHHQGGPTGYRTREELASPKTKSKIEAGTAITWNPTLPGAKIEDTVLCNAAGLEVLTSDASWPTFAVNGQRRPDFLVRP